MSKPTVLIDGKLVAAGVAEDFEKLAAAFRKAFNLTLHVRSGVRDSAEQERIFLARFKPQKNGAGPYSDVKVWKGVRYVRISAAGTVAVPGTSGHERGRDLDIYDSGTDYGVTRAGTVRSNWIKNNAKDYGFNPRGLTFGEPWHIESTRKADDYWKRKTPAKPAPKPKPKPHEKPASAGPWKRISVWNLGLGNTKGITGWLSRRQTVADAIRIDNAQIVLLQEAYWTTAVGHHGLAWLLKQLPQYRAARRKSGRVILVRDDVKVLHVGTYAPKAKAAGHPKKYAVFAVTEYKGVKSLNVSVHAQNGAQHSKVRTLWATELAGMVEASRKWHKVGLDNVYVGGDWNGREGAEVFADHGYVDAVKNALFTQGMTNKTLNSWRAGGVFGTRIDYLLVPVRRPVESATQRDDSSRSDHNRQLIDTGRMKK